MATVSDPRDVRYAFSVEWFDVNAQMNRPYSLFYYTVDDTIEMFDLRNHRMFLKRCKYPSLRLADLFVGASVVVFARQLKVTGYADDFTRSQLDTRKEKTCAIIKPHCYEKIGVILEAFQQAGLVVAHMRSLKLTRDQLAEGFQHLHEQPTFSELLDSMAEDFAVALELVGPNAVRALQDLAGPANPEEARARAPTSLRARYGRDGAQNAVHVSATADAAEREIRFFLGSPFPATATCRDCTLCCVLPHAHAAGHTGAILNTILEEGFEVSAIELTQLDRANASEFLEVYRTVVPEYTSMVDELCNGPVVVCEVRGENVVPSFRELCGPVDPEVAKHIRPQSVRARWGESKIRNAVHCTDLPEDGVLECEYFFRILPTHPL
ncbi:putative Nucleoside diphosphate kinase 7 [Paratrimastix pyriformis]|uniref:Nucleoside diphosphate kinase 7 n=1 Tax=Paratrimastix pyriformis TaxID=342808 RepID=A0ABQ8UVA2_9EUKA|nr:putative Nucleoside diphosphate kinase 7 [Paratrimastix pyriformis]